MLGREGVPVGRKRDGQPPISGRATQPTATTQPVRPELGASARPRTGAGGGFEVKTIRALLVEPGGEPTIPCEPVGGPLRFRGSERRGQG